MTIHWREDFEAPRSNGFSSLLAPCTIQREGFFIQHKRATSSTIKYDFSTKPHPTRAAARYLQWTSRCFLHHKERSVEDVVWKHSQCTKTHQPHRFVLYYRLYKCLDFRPASSWAKFSGCKLMKAGLLTCLSPQVDRGGSTLLEANLLGEPWTSSCEEVHGSIPWQWVYQHSLHLVLLKPETNIRLLNSRPLAISTIQTLFKGCHRNHRYVISLLIQCIMLSCLSGFGPRNPQLLFLCPQC